MKVDEETELNLESKNKHINDLLPENLGQILRSGLSVIDRLHCSRVSRHWKWAVGEFGWTEQKKIDRDTVFKGIPKENIDAFFQKFWQNTTTEDICHLVSMLNRITIGPYNSLMELDLHSFGTEYVQPFVRRIAELLPMFTKLKKLNIEDLNLADFVEFLPSSLRELQISETERIGIQTLEKLSVSCQNLAEVPFDQVDHLTLDIVNAYLPRFPRLKKLNLSELDASPNIGALSSIGQLKQLEVLKINAVECFDDASMEAVIAGCKNLRRFDCGDPSVLSESGFFQLTKLPNLVELKVHEFDGFTNSVLKAIAKRGLLKQLDVKNDDITDEGIQYLIDHCKSLVSLDISDSMGLTERVLRAVVAEVNRRHGNPPRALPSGPDDKEIFIFRLFDLGTTAMDGDRAMEIVAENEQNPWIKFFFD